MTEGTKSYLIGCHQFFLHPLFVLIAWRKHFRRWPTWWQVICIILHDIGICGRSYLSDDGAKKGHWRKGAIWAGKIIIKFNPAIDAFAFCAGHTCESGFKRSELFWADKKSWLIAPMWWLWWNYWVEWSGNGIKTTRPPEWRKLVDQNLKSENPIGSHELYLRHRS